MNIACIACMFPTLALVAVPGVCVAAAFVKFKMKPFKKKVNTNKTKP